MIQLEHRKTDVGIGSSSSLSSMILRLSRDDLVSQSHFHQPHGSLLLRFFLESSSFLVAFSRMGVSVLPPKKLRISAGILSVEVSVQRGGSKTAQYFPKVSGKYHRGGEILLVSFAEVDDVRDFLDARKARSHLN